MMALAFLLAGMSVIGVWLGHRKLAMAGFAVTILLAIALFLHHASSSINISL